MIDLHCHLDGSLRFSTMLDLARQKNIKISENSKDIFFHKGMTLHDALGRFATTLSVLQDPDDVKRVTKEICEDAIQNSISNLEIRFAPQLHKGAAIEEIIDASIEGLSDNANLILCGLYGEDPKVLNRLVEAAKNRGRVVGIDLAGGPAIGHLHGIYEYSDVFLKAKTYGINRTVHAAEGRSSDEIRRAIYHLGAQRIGHGTTLLDNEEEIVKLVIKNNILIEACITSNIHTGVIKEAKDHPIKKWIKKGVKVAICTDNIMLSNTDLAREFTLAKYDIGLTDEELNYCTNCAKEFLFSR